MVDATEMPRGPRARPLATCIASLIALSAPTLALSTNRPVTSCLDDGSPGTLRSVIGDAATVSGDTVDLSALSCPASKITLQTGGSHITIPQSSLTIKGPGAAALAIDGSQLDGYVVNYSNVFYHKGAGTLTVRNLSVTGGHESHRTINGLGGCIYSAANVTLSGVSVSSCTVTSLYIAARGGAVYAKGNVFLANSTISGNSATGGGSAGGGGIWANGNVYGLSSTVQGNSASSSGYVSGGGIKNAGYLYLHGGALSGNSATSTGGYAYGGGAKLSGDFYAGYATISGNQVSAPSNSAGGGVFIQGSTTLVNSTVSDNAAKTAAGLDVFSGLPGANTFLMRNSTISGNHATASIGGLYVNSGTTKFYNSTIAFNTAVITAPGLELSASKAPMSVTLQSTLMSNNTYGAVDNDLTTVNNPAITFNAGPANNLIRITGAGGLPGDTKFITCPLLGPLRDNGGPTRTHALLSTSIAIDSGNDVPIDPGTSQPYANDQRGSLATNGTRDYVRVSGLQADIGAYEVQKDDIVFGAGFDGCL